jgi:phasin protein
MDGVRKTELTDIISGLAGPFAQAGSDATRRFCEQGQSIAKTMAEWNTEMSYFLSHRVARNGEAIGSMTKCQSLPEIFSVQARWVQDAANDYLKEMSKLMEVNGRIMVGLLGSAGQAEILPSPTKVPMRAAS